MPQQLNDATSASMKSQSPSGLRESSGKQALNPSERMTLLSGHQLSIDDAEQPQVGNTYFWIEMKPGATVWNLMSVFFLQFFVMVVASELMAFELPLLMDKNYYNLSIEDATKVEFWENQITGIPTLIFMFLTGYVYDIVGVRFTLCLATFGAGIGLMFYPLGAPHLWILVTGGCLFGVGEDLIGANTLIIDYVAKKSRAKALSFSFMGVCSGVVLSNLVLVHFTRDLDPLIAWSIMAGMMIAFSITMFFTLSEPKNRVKREDAEKPLLRKIWDLTINILKAVKKNPNLLIGWIMNVLVSGPILILEMYYYNWLKSFQPKDGSGPFPDSDTFMNYYERQSTLGSVFALVLLFFAGSVIDKINFRIILPVTLLMRAGVFYMVSIITNPVQQSTLFWIACPGMHVTFYITQVAMQSYLLKIYPKEIRGMCKMTEHISGYILGSGYPFLIQYLYEKDPSYTFSGVSMIDLATIVLLLLLFTIGFGKENLQDNGDDDVIEANEQNEPQVVVIEKQSSVMI